MAGKSEDVASHPAGDWNTPFSNVPSCEQGEFANGKANPVVADLNAKSFSESTRTGDGAPK